MELRIPADVVAAIRAHAAVRMGLARTPAEATSRSPGVPKLAFVTAPASYTSVKGSSVRAEGVDLVGRIMSMGRLHRSYALTGAICSAVAVLVEGTLAHAVARPGPAGERTVRIGHPAGIIEVGAKVARRDGAWIAEKVMTRRTARRLMEGMALVPASVWPLEAPAAATAATRR